MKSYVPIKIEPKMLERLELRAKEYGHNRSSYIRWLIQKDLEKQDKPKDQTE